jgi:SAM-dependent methyltransferase
MKPARAQQARLVSEQYRDDNRLRSRYLVHQLFSTAERDYLDWIFDHLLRAQPSSILDVGSGPGYLWQHNSGRVPADWSLTLGDRSPGMLSRAAAKLQQLKAPAAYVRLEAESMPFPDGSFDVLLGLHILHHLDDVPAVLDEMKRLLIKNGRLLTATNGERHMRQFRYALEQCNLETIYFSDTPGFSLQNGEAMLEELFDRVECIHFKDALHVTQVGPLLEYARSGISPEHFDEQREALERLERHWQELLEREGAIHIEKQAGLFIAE